MQDADRTAAALNFQHLRTFSALARIGSFSRAGEQVGLSQPAVSRHIRALEDRMGVRLFERIGRRAVLTSAGRALQARVDALMRGARELPRVLKDLSEGLQGDLRIGASITAANAFLPALLGRYRQRHPGVELALQPGSSARLIESLRRGELDVAFTASDRLPSDVTTLAEIPDEIVLFATPGHELCRRRQLKPANLSGCDFIQREPASETRRVVTRWFETEGVRVRSLMDVW